MLTFSESADSRKYLHDDDILAVSLCISSTLRQIFHQQKLSSPTERKTGCTVIFGCYHFQGPYPHLVHSGFTGSEDNEMSVF